MLALAAAFALSACEPWCEHPCAELNGNIELECGSCDGSAACNPATFTETPPPPPPQPTRMGGMGMGGMGMQRATVNPTGGVAAESLFIMPDAPRAAATAYSESATAEDEKVVRAAHGHCDSPACARVKLQRLRRRAQLDALQTRLPGANVTAGGKEVPCEFQRATRDELEAMTLKERRNYLTRFPTLISGATDGWPAHAEWADPQAFSKRYGHHHLKAIRASYGFNRLSKLGGSNCMMFDEAGCPGQANATVPLSELIPTSDNEQIVIMDLFDMNKGEHDLLTDLSKAYELPEFLDALSNVRLLSLGGRPEGVQMSKHHSAWLSVVAGAKLWHLAPPDVPQPSDRYCVDRGPIDYKLAKREGVIHCMAYPSEVVVVPDNWWHATCNMLPYTIAIGGQTWDNAAGTPFEARSAKAAAATAERWKEGRGRPLNQYQSAIATEGGLVEGLRLPSGL